MSKPLDIRHVYIRPRTPHLNGKVERSHRVDDEEFYQLLDQGGITDDIHLFNEKLREWEDYYNYHRPHGALDGQTPYERLVAKRREPECYRSLKNLQAKAGGEAGIRTLGRAFRPYNGLANRRLQPLGHLTLRLAAQRANYCRTTIC